MFAAHQLRQLVRSRLCLIIFLRALALPSLAQAKLQDAFVNGRRESAVFQCPESRVLEGPQLGNALYSRLPNAGTLRFRRVPVLGL